MPDMMYGCVDSKINWLLLEQYFYWYFDHRYVESEDLVLLLEQTTDDAVIDWRSFKSVVKELCR